MPEVIGFTYNDNWRLAVTGCLLVSPRDYGLVIHEGLIDAIALWFAMRQCLAVGRNDTARRLSHRIDTNIPAHHSTPFPVV